MFEQLGNRIERAIHALQGRSQITEINIATTAKEIRRALLQADVGYSVANELTKQIKEEALGRKVISSLSPGKLFTAITCEALTRLMGEKEAALDLSGSPNVIVLAGLQGAGKTTFATKLAAHIKKQGIQPLLTSCDVHRPAAREQLKVMAEKAGLSVYAAGEENDPCALAEKSLAYAAAHGYKTVIVDTAGRLSIDAAMMEELVAIRRLLSPQETLLVVDAMTGQDAVRMAEDFRRQIDYTGVVLTKLDGDTRGGAALSLRAVADVPIKFISYGEKVDALDVFHPDRMAKRILGMGDVVTLVARAQEAFDQKEMQSLTKKAKRNTFDLVDFLGQIQRFKKMGGAEEILSMVPGMRKLRGQVDWEVSQQMLQRAEVIVGSMTPEERSRPALIDAKRRRRIALGSGSDLKEVSDLLKRYDMARKMMKKGLKGQGGGGGEGLFSFPR